MTVNLTILLCCVNLKNKDLCILLTEGGLPTTTISSSITDSLKELSNSYVNIDVGWLNYRLISYFDSPPTIIFGAYIPEEVDLVKGKFTRILDLDEKFKKLIPLIGLLR